MPPVLIAAAIAATATIGATVYSSNQQSSANKRAINAQQQAADAATAEQKREYDQSRTDQLPWLQTGQAALDRLGQITGVGPGATPGQSAPDYTSFYQSPDYQFRMSEGLRGLTANAAATGGLDSGAERKAEIGYAGNLAAGDYNSYVSKLQSLAGVGQSTATNLANQGQAYATNIGNIAQYQGNNRASSYLAQGAIGANTASTIAGIGNGLIMNTVPPNGGSPGFNAQASGGAGAFTFSDRRLKLDIEPIGSRDGHDWYRFRYAWDAPGIVREGVMAQDLGSSHPAVSVHESGYLMVDYGAL